MLAILVLCLAKSRILVVQSCRFWSSVPGGIVSVGTVIVLGLESYAGGLVSVKQLTVAVLLEHV